MRDLEEIAESAYFRTSEKLGQAEALLWALSSPSGGSTGISIAEIGQAFGNLGLVKPHATRLKDQFKKSRNVRSVSSGRYAPTRDFSREMETIYPEIGPAPLQPDAFDVASIPLPPFVPADRQADLAKMVRVYGLLFLLENSMRALIERVLLAHLGQDWWDKAASTSMKRKHDDRLRNEKDQKWAPARSEFGPLYAIDWGDLITIMRKYPLQFQPHFKDMNFLHRFEDAGIFRNVIAHNGVLRDEDAFDRIGIYYRDWMKQLS